MIVRAVTVGAAALSVLFSCRGALAEETQKHDNDKKEEGQWIWPSGVELEIGPTFQFGGGLPFPVHFGGRTMVNSRINKYVSFGLGVSYYQAPTAKIYNAPVSGSHAHLEFRACGHASRLEICGTFDYGNMYVQSADGLGRWGIPDPSYLAGRLGVGTTLWISPVFGFRPIAELGLLFQRLEIVVDSNANQIWSPLPIYGVLGLNLVISLPNYVTRR